MEIGIHTRGQSMVIPPDQPNPLTVHPQMIEKPSSSSSSPHTPKSQRTPLVKYKHANWLTRRRPSLLVDPSVLHILDEIIVSFVIVENMRCERSHWWLGSNAGVTRLRWGSWNLGCWFEWPMDVITPFLLTVYCKEGYGSRNDICLSTLFFSYTFNSFKHLITLIHIVLSDSDRSGPLAPSWCKRLLRNQSNEIFDSVGPGPSGLSRNFSTASSSKQLPATFWEHNNRLSHVGGKLSKLKNGAWRYCGDVSVDMVAD